MLMLANSSLALELITHDAHGHTIATDSQIQMSTLPVADDSAHSPSRSHSHPQTPSHTLSHDQHGNPAADTAQAADDAETAPSGHPEDCVCDEICCISSVYFSIAADGYAELSGFLQKLLAGNHYQSISLDLVPPPPTV